MDPIADITGFFDPTTGTATHVVACRTSGDAAVIDPVLDYDAKSGRTSTASAGRVLAHLRTHGLRLTWILETHAHADHLSAAFWLREQAGGRIAIGRRIVEAQASFGRLFGLGPDFHPDGRDFDHLLADDEWLHIGQLPMQAWWVPGHTLADMAYVVGSDVFIGDTLFMPDVGSARCDFPGGDARTLYRSLRRLLALPPTTRLHLCHDYPPTGRSTPRWLSTVAEQRAHNIHVHDGIAEDSFVAMREARDATLAVPTLILPALQVNIRAGRLPAPEASGIAYLRIPLNAIGRDPAA
jgi:glyoxylase-like metal-dependent hydrolase (beta-lactamase superfamily II)